MNEKESAALNAHLNAFQDVAKRLQTQLAPALELQEGLRKSLQPIIDAQNSIQKILEPILTRRRDWEEALASITIPRFEVLELSQVAAQAAEMQRSIGRLISPAFEELQKTFRELPPRTQEALIVLGEHGWYLDPEMSLPGLWELKEALANGVVSDAENALCEYFEARLLDIENSICGKYPRRAHLIKAAFAAHRRQEYELAIPVLLAQTDGICKEVVNQYFFRKYNKKPCTAIYVEQIAADGYRAALLSPLARTLPIAASESERPEGFSALNRHTVLHGDALDYGTKINSLKAVSLINYVADVLHDEKTNP